MIRIKRPKYSPYYRHCYQCGHWSFSGQNHAEIWGTCNAIKGAPSEEDAYQGACGLWIANSKKKFAEGMR